MNYSGEFSPPSKLSWQVVKEVDYPERLNDQLLDNWSRADLPYDQEYISNKGQTPIEEIELPLGGIILIKDESDTSINPSGTVKDRLARSLTRHYAMLGKTSLGQNRMADDFVPRISTITSGNEGLAIARCFESFDLPPPKLLMDKKTPENVVDLLREERADIYTVDLHKKSLSHNEILKLTNNPWGIDLTSTMMSGSALNEYRKLVWHVLRLWPDMVFVPYGSGRLFENFIQYQKFNKSRVTKNPSVIGVSPADISSRADKLTAPFRPFSRFKEEHLDDLREVGRSGSLTGVMQVSDGFIEQAEELLSSHDIKAEPSGAVGLAGAIAMQHHVMIELNSKYPFPGDRKTLAINTGKGIFEA